MKHEYTADELAELKSIYDESGEAGLQIGEMRALRKAGLLTQGLPAKPSKRDLILAHCRKRISQGQPFDGKETAEALNLSQKTVGNILSQLRKEGLLPAFNQHSPRKTRKTTTTGKKKETIMTVTSKPAANKEEPMSQTTTSKITADDITESKPTVNDVTTGTINVKPQATADPRTIISNALTDIFDAISALQKTAFQTNDKVVYGFATKLLNGELMDIKANYSKDTK
ncbi:helix-turn-helix domain-containing protein [Bifidobacterium pseudocatenulatum]|uniref:helix-turn-helix domain-containing protein n=1 Tax=Bifidobacterium pseudocatenulatum TaxID=28026 RepID=UPI001F0F0E30|nr:helix-turn-helix domain-containing protein [Bifidobacterium pseudocatenulatum]MCH4859266.1 helix-turn-helix domain-containing protein [Bifidobacterium pseudocatenulatum]